MATPKKKSPVKKATPAKKVATKTKKAPAKTAKTKTVKAKTVKKKSSSGRASFPTKELTSWLQDRHNWDHGDWLGLLDNIKDRYPHLTETDEGRSKIGEFLEMNRQH